WAWVSMLFTKDRLPEDRAEAQPPADTQAVLTVIGRRTRTYGNGETRHLDLSKTILQGADLGGAQLHGANLGGAQLQGAILGGAENLDQDQIKEACTDENTKLPEGLTRPAPCRTQP